MKQSEEIGEIAFWQKIRKTGHADFKTVFENTTKYSKLRMCTVGTVNCLSSRNSSRLASQIKIFGEAPPKSKAS